MRTLLVQDAESDTQPIGALLARSTGGAISMEQAGSADAALGMLARRQYDVVIISAKSSGVAALTMLRQLQAAEAGVPIIVLSEMEDHAFALRALQAGAQDVLPREQLDPQRLEWSLRLAVERQRLSQAQRSTEIRLNAALLAAEAAEAHFRVVFESARDGIVVIDMDGRYRDANPATVEMLGYSWDEICQRHVGDFSAEDPERSRLDFKLLMEQDGGTLRIRRERRLRRRDGREIIVEQHATRVALPIGTCIVSVWRDVTEQRRASDALRQWAEYFEHSEQGLFVAPPAADAPGICNPAYARMHGATVEQVAALPRLSFVAAAEQPNMRDRLRRIDTEGHLVFETVHVRTDGTEFPVMIDATAVRGDDGEVRYRMIHVTDITERRRIEQERAQLLAQAHEAEARAIEQLRKEFLATVAHELRNPLAAIAGWAQLLRRGTDPDRAARIITDQTQQLDRIIGDLLDMSQLDAGKLEMRLGSVDVADLARSVIEQEQASSLTHRIQYRGPERGVAATIDAQRVAQILRNLLSNAVKYSPEGGDIVIEVTDSGGEITVSVSDQGLGIAANALDAVFDRYARLEGGREVARGSGLGLPISRALAEAHGGSLRVESLGEGQGSRFILTLPRR